jgi:hypothetical protein
VPRLTVKVRPDVGATVRVAGLVVDRETVEVPRHPGFVGVAVSAPGFIPVHKLVELKGDETTVEITLVALPSKRFHVKPYIMIAMVVLALVKMFLACR